MFFNECDCIECSTCSMISPRIICFHYFVTLESFVFPSKAFVLFHDFYCSIPFSIVKSIVCMFANTLSDTMKVVFENFSYHIQREPFYCSYFLTITVFLLYRSGNSYVTMLPIPLLYIVFSIFVLVFLSLWTVYVKYESSQ